MKLNKFLSLLLFILLFSGTSKAQQSPEEINKQFFEKYGAGDSDKALEYLLGKVDANPEYKLSLEDLKKKFKSYQLIAGKYTGYELLAKRYAGESLVMFTFLAKHERNPLTFRIVFYKPLNTWQVQNFRYNGNMEEELEEASKAYRFKENFAD